MPAPKEIRPMDICPDNLVRVNRMGLALGWGNIGYEIESTHLNEVNLTVKGISEDKVQFFTNTVYNETVLDTCAGDSGGPLLFKQKDLFCLAGTVQQGWNCSTSVDYHNEMEEEGQGGSDWNNVPEMTRRIQETKIYLEPPSLGKKKLSIFSVL